jgi:pimeloyl-ACP methyl ester carboxylesterase
MTTPADIDRSAPVIARHEIDIDAPLDTVWRLQTDVNGWPAWQADITAAHLDGPFEPGASFTWTSYGFTVTSTVYAVAERARTLWGGAANGIMGTHEWVYRQTPTGVHVTTQESFSGEPVAADITGMQSALDKSLTDWLGHLKTIAESQADPASHHHSDEGARMSATTTDHVTAEGIGTVAITVSERGEGHPVLLLHGGGGPLTVTGWADQLAGARHARVLTPVHPGFDGTPRPAALNSVGTLARLYVALLGQLKLRDVTVVGNSIGGWIAAEMAVLGSDRVSSYVLVDAVGIELPGHPVADFFSLTPEQVAQRSFYDPDAFGADPASLPPEAQAAMADVRAALAVYASAGMTDPTLSGRLAGVDAPVLVVWGEADRIGDPDYGRAYADAIPGARFLLLEQAGHLPQLEAPEALIDAVWSFADAHAASTAGPTTR